MRNEQQKKAYFFGHEISEYGVEHNRVDYLTLSKSFDCVLCNNICDVDNSVIYNVINGDLYEYYDENGERITPEQFNENEENGKHGEIYPVDIFQWFIVSDNAVELLKQANEIVLYSDRLDCYIWCVTHYGTAWDYVLTEIKINEEDR